MFASPPAWALLTALHAPPEPVSPPAEAPSFSEVVELEPPRRSEADVHEEPGPPEAYLLEKPPRRRRVRGRMRERGHKLVVLPSLHADSNVGFQIGGQAAYTWQPEDTDELPAIRLFWLSRVSNRLVQNHRVVLFLRDLSDRGEEWVIEFKADDDPTFPWTGNLDLGLLTNEALEEEDYRTDMLTIGGRVAFGYPVFETPRAYPGALHPGVLRLVGFARFEADRIRPFEDSLLELDRPQDEGWVRRGSLALGLVWDGRNNDVSPSGGSQHDLTFEGAGAPTGSTDTWGRINATSRFYRSIVTDRLVVAARGTVDLQFGDPPLFNLGEFGGFRPVEGVGGAFVGRGMWRRRFVGVYKAALGPELRTIVLETMLFRWRFDVGLNAFTDLSTAALKDERFFDHLHLSGGGGAYLWIERFFLFRGEVAASRESIQFYFVAEHAF